MGLCLPSSFCIMQPEEVGLREVGMNRFSFFFLIVWGGLSLLSSSAAGQDRALTLCNSNDPDEIISGCSTMISKSKNPSPRASAIRYLRRGHAYMRKDDLDRAMSDFTAAIKADPTLVGPRVFRGELYLKKNDQARAKQDLEWVASQNVTDEIDVRNQNRAKILLASNPVTNNAASYTRSGDSGFEIVPSVGHVSMMTSVAGSPDGRWVVSAGMEGFKLWERENGRLLRTLSDNIQLIQSIAFMPDSRTLVTGGEDKLVRLWDIESGKIQKTLSGHSGMVFAVITDGRRIVSASADKTVRIWDAKSGDTVRVFSSHDSGLTIHSIAMNGSTIVSGDTSGKVLVWNADNGQIEHRLTEATSFPSTVAISRDGKTIIVGGKKNVRIFDRRTGQLRHTSPDYEYFIGWVGILPDGKTAISAGRDYIIRLWNIETGGQKLEMNGLEYETLRGFPGASKSQAIIGDGFRSAALLPDGKLVSVSQGSASSKIVGGQKLKFWDLETGKVAQEFARGLSGLESVTHGKKPQDVYVQYEGGVKYFDLTSGKLSDVGFIGQYVRSRAMMYREGEIFVPRHDTLAMMSERGGEVVDAGKLNSESLMATLTKNWTVFPKRDVLVTAKKGGVVSRQLKSGADEKAYSGLNSDVSTITATSDERYIFAGTESGSVVSWDVRDGRKVLDFKAHEKRVDNIVFSNDGRRFATSGDFRTKVWESDSGKLVREFSGHRRPVSSIAFSGDNKKILSASHDRLISVANIATGGLERMIAGHVGGVYQIAFSSDKRKLLSISTDTSLRVWDASSHQHLTSTLFFRSGDWLTITPEGFFESSEKGAQYLTIVKGLEFYSIDQVYQSLYRPDLVQEKLAGDPKGLVRDAAAKLDLTKVMASGPAPNVKIVSPRTGASQRSDDVLVEAEIVDTAGGIGKVEWRVNGLTLGVEERGLARAESSSSNTSAPSRPPLKITRSLALEAGDNVIEVVAYNAKNLIASLPARITVKWDGASFATAPKLHVLAVGINDYWDSRLKLSFAVPDVKAISSALTRAGKDLYSSVQVTNVIDAEATAENLDKVFTDIGKTIHPRDVFLFFLAGHGKTVDGKYYFLPRDFRYEGEESISKKGIDQDQFQRWFARIGARKSVLLYDTCESGSLTGDRVQQRGIERVAALEKMTRAMGRTVLSASTDDAPALEGYKGHGVFTYAFLEGVGGADTNGNGLIEVTELAAYIDQKVPELSFAAFKQRQIPQMKIVGSNFSLANKVAVISAVAIAPSAVPTKPTHVVIMPSQVRQLAAASAVATGQLEAGTQVTLIETDSGWAIVARDGKRLGYVDEKALAKLQ